MPLSEKCTRQCLLTPCGILACMPFSEKCMRFSVCWCIHIVYEQSTNHIAGLSHCLFFASLFSHLYFTPSFLSDRLSGLSGLENVKHLSLRTPPPPAKKSLAKPWSSCMSSVSNASILIFLCLGEYRHVVAVNFWCGMYALMNVQCRKVSQA